MEGCVTVVPPFGNNLNIAECSEKYGDFQICWYDNATETIQSSSGCIVQGDRDNLHVEDCSEVINNNNEAAHWYQDDEWRQVYGLWKCKPIHGRLPRYGESEIPTSLGRASFDGN